MKVGIYLVNHINPSLGGNFSYHEKFIRAVDAYEFNTTITLCFVGRLPKTKVKLKKSYVKLAPSFVYSAFNILTKFGITDFVSRFFGFNIDLCSLIDSSRMRRNGVDIVLFPNQFLKKVYNFPFITMNWDAGHKSTYAFPELLEHFEARERWYRVEIQKAFAIFVESQSSKEEFSTFYSIPENKIEVIPLFAGGVVDYQVEEKFQQEILRKLNLEGVLYFYYPAQFWAHKNHYNLIVAIKELIAVEGGEGVRLVLSGSDKGNKEYIASVIREHKLEKNVLMLGFISNEEVFTLYKNAVALVMPTFLGPTNMPLLEAQYLHTAIICSDLKGHRETCGDGAVYCDPANPAQWVNAMRDTLKSDFRESLIARANQVLLNSPFTVEKAIKSLEQALIKFKAIRKTFY